MLIDTIGAPVVVTVVLLVAYYAYLYIRGERRAVHWAIILVIFSAFLNPDTIGFSSLRATPHPWLAIGSGGVLCFMGIRQERLKQLLAGTAVLLIGISSKYFPHWNFEQVLYVLLHGTLVTSYGLSLVYDDRFARWICRTAPRYIGSLAFVIACGYPILWRELPVVTHAWLLAMVVLLSWLHWWRSPILRRFIASIQAASWLTAMGIGRVAWGVLHASELRGIRFLVGGVLLLTVGLAISLLKGGGYRRWLQTLYMVNRQREADFRV